MPADPYSVVSHGLCAPLLQISPFSLLGSARNFQKRECIHTYRESKPLTFREYTIMINPNQQDLWQLLPLLSCISSLLLSQLQVFVITQLCLSLLGGCMLLFEFGISAFQEAKAGPALKPLPRPSTSCITQQSTPSVAFLMVYLTPPWVQQTPKQQSRRCSCTPIPGSSCVRTTLTALQCFWGAQPTPEHVRGHSAAATARKQHKPSTCFTRTVGLPTEFNTKDSVMD